MPDKKKMKRKAAAGKAAGRGTKAAGRAGKAPARAKEPKAAAPARGAARGAGAKRSAAPKVRPPPGQGPDPEGFFVARVRGEEAVREAPRALGEGAAGGEAAARALAEAEAGPAGPYDEGLGDLPAAYGEDALVALPRDPRTLFLYWEHTPATREAALEGLERPRAELRVFARSAGGWELLRTVDVALEARGHYVHDLEAGRAYRAEIHLVDRAGREHALGGSSNEVELPTSGPSGVVDDRFARIPWGAPLGRGPGPGRHGGPFSEEARARLASLSDWSRFRTQAGEPGGAAERPTSPSSPGGGYGGRDR